MTEQTLQQSAKMFLDGAAATSRAMAHAARAVSSQLLIAAAEFDVIADKIDQLNHAIPADPVSPTDDEPVEPDDNGPWRCVDCDRELAFEEICTCQDGVVKYKPGPPKNAPKKWDEEPF